MGTTILKAERDVDFYVYWSDYTEEPIGWGTRSEILHMLFEDDPTSNVTSRLERMARADERGTSSRIGHGRWDSDGLIFRQQGVLPRSELRALCELYEANDLKAPKRKAAAHLLWPFEDHDLDRAGEATRPLP